MRYAGFKDRKVSTIVAFTIILIFGITMTSVILNAIHEAEKIPATFDF
jgi:hypothetical protein